MGLKNDAEYEINVKAVSLRQRVCIAANKKIEVNYLRSLYQLEINDAGGLNVIFGRNDSGKSNFLRALNLFFNGKSEPFRDFDFDLDMSDIRKREARDAKGRQFIWIKLTFRVPENYTASLGEEIEVKKQWNRNGDVTMSVWPKHLTEDRPNPRLTRFLNDIDFTYIPAIKDISLYADLVERLYAAAAQSAHIADASEKFVEEIGRGTQQLTKNLGQLFNTQSALSPPTALRQLFRNLDFSYSEEKHSLLRQKGDGIKARHIPEILRFINESEQRSRFYIWGFEEPENSLDLNSAKLEADRFAEISNRPDTQIFLTSHSPAFYLSSSESGGIRRFFVSKQLKTDVGIRPANAATSIDDIDDAETSMESAGLMQLPYVIKSLQDLPQKIAQVEVEKSNLQKQLKDLEKPTLFFEGCHDIKIMKSRFSESDNVKLRTLKGTPSTIPALLTGLDREGKLVLGSKGLIVFDNDPPGRSAMKKMIGREPIDYSKLCSVAGQLSVMCLPSSLSPEFCLFGKELGLSEKDLIFEGEFLLDPCAVGSKLKELGFKGEYVHEDYYKKPQDIFVKMQKYEIGSSGWLFSRTVPDELKGKIIDECLGQGDEPVLDGLETIIREYLNEN